MAGACARVYGSSLKPVAEVRARVGFGAVCSVVLWRTPGRAIGSQASGTFPASTMRHAALRSYTADLSRLVGDSDGNYRWTEAQSSRAKAPCSLAWPAGLSQVDAQQP